MLYNLDVEILKQLNPEPFHYKIDAFSLGKSVVYLAENILSFTLKSQLYDKIHSFLGKILIFSLGAFIYLAFMIVHKC